MGTRSKARRASASSSVIPPRGPRPRPPRSLFSADSPCFGRGNARILTGASPCRHQNPSPSMKIPAPTAAEPRTIDEVLVRLNGILDDALRQGARIGYFAALYERVTTNIRRALIAGNVFQDNARMERLDVIFANRFMAAWDAHTSGRRPSRSWQAAFLRCWTRPGDLQHLLLGMNAHINLDLGIAAATVAHTPAELAGAVAGLQDHQRRAVAAGAGGGGRAGADLAAAAPHRGDRPRAGEPRVRLRDRRGARLRLGAGDGAGAHAPGRLGDAHRRAGRAGGGGGGRPVSLHGIAGRVQGWIHAAESADVRYNIQVVAE